MLGQASIQCQQGPDGEFVSKFWITLLLMSSWVVITSDIFAVCSLARESLFLFEYAKEIVECADETDRSVTRDTEDDHLSMRCDPCYLA
jgi:hypothetical protein